MQPTKISIKGNYIDCQIYRGRLYLWTLEGTLRTYNWNNLVDSLIKDESDRFAYTYSFIDGHFLYTEGAKQIFQDEEFKNLLLSKFSRLSGKNIKVSENDINHFLIKEQDVPGGEIPIDTEIYNNNLYFINDNGFFKAAAHRISGNPVSSRPSKLWDARLVSIRANRYPQIALSAGEDGLFEYNASTSAWMYDEENVERNISLLTEKHSSYANYSFLSVYNTSLVGKSFMLYFQWKSGEKHKPYTRTREKEIDSENIFGIDKGFSWGSGDKLYLVDESGMRIVRFSNKRTDYEQNKMFSKIPKVKAKMGHGTVINSGTAYFGNIIEYLDSLMVLLSNGHTFVINEPVTKWRIYPRSINYENQLHVILDDRIEIYSFNHDYFESQVNKTLGLEYVDETYLRAHNNQ